MPQRINSHNLHTLQGIIKVGKNKSRGPAMKVHTDIACFSVLTFHGLVDLAPADLVFLLTDKEWVLSPTSHILIDSHESSF